jgi:DNA (cytosine-5)-methyltransferase 1
MRFIDLFAGLGGFHKSLSSVGHECVFACEKDINLRTLYDKNFGIECHGDIKAINERDIPAHDILCSGFPCQPFSKAGNQKGLKDKGRGDLIYDIFRILRHHRPQYVILENVPNLRRHDREKTWRLIERTLCQIGYDVKEKILSPHQFGVPQIRERIFIVASLGVDSLVNFNFPIAQRDPEIDIRRILDVNPANAKRLQQVRLECLQLWQQIINVIPIEDPLPGFPIWGMEFEATYPIEGKSPHALSSTELGKFTGAFGIPLKGLKKREQMALLPSYAQYEEYTFPQWKREYLLKIRQFLNKYRDVFESLFQKLSHYPPSWQKLEWNCGANERVLLNYIIQFRASGIRVKKTDFSPALVLNSTQIPIVGWEQRYITLTEAARLQGLHDIELPEIKSQAYRALGNAVNVTLARLIAQSLIPRPTGAIHQNGQINGNGANGHVIPLRAEAHHRTEPVC